MRVAVVKPPLSGHNLRGSGIYYEQLQLHLNQIKDIDLLTGNWHTVKGKADVYHFAYFDLFFLTLPFFIPPKSIVTVHDVIPLKFPDQFPLGLRGKFKLTIQKFLLKQVSLIVTDSFTSKADIIDLLNIDKTKIEVVYLAAGREFYPQKSLVLINQVLKKYNLPQEYFIYVGDGNWNKNLPNLIRAALHTKINLLLVGPPLDTKPKIHSWTASLGQVYEMIQNHANIFKLRNISAEELNCLYQGAQALIFPTFYEGFGLPVMEAFSAGCPVITTDRGSLKEIINEAALVVDPEKITSIVEAIKKVIFDKSLRQNLIEKGLRQAHKFSWYKTAHQMVKIYHQVNRT